jgi:methylmalonyl-CoA mutase cobalamin-binding subunit
MTRTVLAAALGECVHVAGVINFLQLAESAGWHTVFLGPACSIEQVLQAVNHHQPELVGISYRLTAETGEQLLAEFAEAADEFHASGIRFVFGGTPPLAEKASALGFFEQVFDGSQTRDQVLAYLNSQSDADNSAVSYPQSAIERILWKAPYPLLRHHFGLPDLTDTIRGIETIAKAQALDVISLGIDQDAQENFYHPERQDLRRKGAGGVPVRAPADYAQLFDASRRGNFPLLRTYSGTDDFIRLAEMAQETIHNAWCAIPLFWFNQMDGRGPWDLEGSIRQHQQVMTWHGQRNFPVELNEPHHWGMRDAPDVIFVVSAYLSAYNARAFGVHDYIAQLMFNSPPGLSNAMDLAKMLAVFRMIEPLSDANFRIWRQTRTGLLSYPLEDNAARAHLATSVSLQMALKPHIIHIVGHTEAHHAATAQDVIAASLMARRAIDNVLTGAPDMTLDPVIHQRQEFLLNEAEITLQAIRSLASADTNDPFTDPAVLARAVSSGILDAPHLRNNRFAKGLITTRILNGACDSVNPDGNPLPEAKRLSSFLK